MSNDLKHIVHSLLVIVFFSFSVVFAFMDEDGKAVLAAVLAFYTDWRQARMEDTERNIPEAPTANEMRPNERSSQRDFQAPV